MRTATKYEHSSERLLILQSGLSSFLVRFQISQIMDKKNIDELAEAYLKYTQAWSIEFAGYTTSSPTLTEIVKIRKGIKRNDLKRLEERKKIVQTIHLKLIHDNSEITSGIHPELKWILGTDFKRPDIEYKSREFLKELLD